VKESPTLDSDEISQETEQNLYTHYGLGYSERRSGSGLPDDPGGWEGASDTGLRQGSADSPADTSGGRPGLTRSEEELKVGKRATDAGEVRLKKWVETEPVEAQVELRSERARVSREPINEPVSGVEICEEEAEMSLHREEAVVQKQTVAKEQVSVEKDLTSETETVRDEVRKERVEVEGEHDR
jgi:uncharacterized protein (TIGR02271 family)